MCPITSPDVLNTYEILGFQSETPAQNLEKSL